MDIVAQQLWQNFLTRHWIMKPLKAPLKKMIQQSKNYRPVSVLPIVSKVFERLMHKEMSIFFESFLSLYMCWYTETFLVHKKPYWLWLKHGNKNLIERDTINYDLLSAKLHAHGFTNKSLSLIKSPLTNHWQRAKVNKINQLIWTAFMSTSGIYTGTIIFQHLLKWLVLFSWMYCVQLCGWHCLSCLWFRVKRSQGWNMTPHWILSGFKLTTWK